ncbi:MAG TPA: hypothetical protein VFA74_11750 [Terriglobales bacterium]|nr:hypothetical protein [Terriglobales bacterium]
MRALITGNLLFAFVLTTGAWSAELKVPAQVTAGTGFSISASRSGQGTFYLIGPAEAVKRQVDLGSDIQIQSEEVERVGRYTALVCNGDQCSSAHFYVHAAAPDRLGLIVHPSRVPVSNPNAISAVVFVFDDFHNLVLSPQSVKLTVTPTAGSSISASRNTQNGVAWVRLNSAPKGGPAKIEAAIGKASEIRVVQQVASDACNLQMKSSWTSGKLVIETNPIRDCTGNFVPDGTVVSFTKTDDAGKTTVDVPIKKGIAKIEMPVTGHAHITVASGVVTGNELNVSGGQ